MLPTKFPSAPCLGSSEVSSSSTCCCGGDTVRHEMNRSATLTLLVIAVFAVLATVAFMTIGARGNWSFVLPFRATKLFALVLVAYSIAVSTVLFQTITNNRILTPAIMGFDWLYMLLQTVFVFFLGAAA